MSIESKGNFSATAIRSVTALRIEFAAVYERYLGRQGESYTNVGIIAPIWNRAEYVERRVVRKEDEHFSPSPQALGVHLVDAEKTRPC